MIVKPTHAERNRQEGLTETPAGVQTTEHAGTVEGGSDLMQACCQKSTLSV